MILKTKNTLCYNVFFIYIYFVYHYTICNISVARDKKT